MRHPYLASLVLPFALSLGACGGSVLAGSGPDPSRGDSSTDAGAAPDAAPLADASAPADASADASADSGECTGGSYPIGCGGVLLYCCPAGANCATPSCGVPVAPADAGDPAPADAGDPTAPADAGACPPGEYLLQPCCGGDNDSSCSNGPGPPPPFCTTLPASCAGQTMCTLGGCEGEIDEANHTFGCNCI